MAAVTQEFMYELLKKKHQRTDKIDVSLGGYPMVWMHQDIYNIYGIRSA
jgi:hypothetical protein